MMGHQGRTAFLFPGQGSQFIGMGKAVFEAYPEARDAFEEADEALHFALSTLCFDGDEQELRRTENTQPAILTVSVALFRVLCAAGADAEWMAGHSLGQYSALVAAGSLSLPDAVQLVRQRGRYMQEAVPEGQGAMAAILGLDAQGVVAVCDQVMAEGAETVQPANFNSPGQVVVAGHHDAVARAVEVARDRGARRAKLLSVSAPFHCSLMRPAAERLRADLARVEFSDPRVPVICNVDAVALTQATEIPSALSRQVTSPVRWADGLRTIDAAGAERYVEVGPGKVLAGLTKRTLGPVTVSSVQEPSDIAAELALRAGRD